MLITTCGFDGPKSTTLDTWGGLYGPMVVCQVLELSWGGAKLNVCRSTNLQKSCGQGLDKLVRIASGLLELYPSSSPAVSNKRSRQEGGTWEPFPRLPHTKARRVAMRLQQWYPFLSLLANCNVKAKEQSGIPAASHSLSPILLAPGLRSRERALVCENKASGQTKEILNLERENCKKTGQG